MATQIQELPIQRLPETKEQLIIEAKKLIENCGSKRLHSRLKQIDGYKDRIADHTYTNLLEGKASYQAFCIFINAMNQLIEIESFTKEKGYTPAIETA